MINKDTNDLTTVEVPKGNPETLIETPIETPIQKPKEPIKVDSKILIVSDKKTDFESMAENRRAELSKKFIRVADSYLKEVHQPDKHGYTNKIWVKRDKGTVQDDLGKSSIHYKQIKKYEGFVNIPNHLNFKQDIQGFFNEYGKLSYQPKDGNFETITMFLNHVFGEKTEFILDYLKLLYCNPTERLPIILLESKERGTGKSTFGSLLKLMFEENTAKCGNSDLESDFNAIWVKRLCIIVDETSLDGKGVYQMLKRFSTETGKVTVNEKNKAQQQIDFFGKFIFCSNEEGKALPISKGETRFAIFKVPTFKEKGIKENPNIEDDLKKEIPFFVNYLMNRKLHHKKQGRMFFEVEDFKTPQLEFYYANSLSSIGKAIKDLIKDCFNFFEDEDELCYSITNLIHLLSTRTKFTESRRIKESLRDDFSIEEQKKGRYQFFNLHGSELAQSEIPQPINSNSIYYKFKRNDFIM